MDPTSQNADITMGGADSSSGQLIADGHNLASGPAENSNSIEYYIETMHHRAARLLWLEMMQETIIEMFKICDETQMAKFAETTAKCEVLMAEMDKEFMRKRREHGNEGVDGDAE